MSTALIQLKQIPAGMRCMIRRTWKLLLLVAFVLPVYAQPAMEFPEKGSVRLEISPNWDTARLSDILRRAEQEGLGRHKPDSALWLMNRTLAASKAISFSYGIGASLYQIGNAYAVRSLDIEAESAFRQAIPYCMQSARGQKILPNIFNNLGRLYQLRGDFRKAANCYYHGIMLARNYFPDVEIDHYYSNLGSVLMQLGRTPENVRYYLDKAETAARKKKNYYVLGNVLINKGTTYNSIKSWDSSIRYFNEALDVAVAHHLPQVKYLAFSNLGIAYMEKSMPAQAISYMEQAQDLTHKHLIDLAYQNNTATALGAAYMQQGRYRESEKVLLQAEHSAVLHNQHFVAREAHWNLARLYGAMGSYRKAYTHAQSYMTMNDSLAGEEIIKNVNQAEVKFRTAEKDRELMGKQLLITRQERDLEHKNLWITLTVSVAVIIGLISAGLYSNHLTKRHLMAEKLSRLEQEQEIGRLRAVMEGEENERNRIARELHDGIGGLITAAQLSAVVLLKENTSLDESETYRKVTGILDDIGNEVRKTAHNLMPEVLLHHNLPEAIRHFCRNIQQNRGLQIDLQTYGNFELLSNDYRLSIYRIVQELVHNVVKHAGAAHALIQIVLHPPILSITIEDNGCGFDTEQTNRTPGSGLGNLRNRVHGMKGSLSVKSVAGKGTSVYIEIGVGGKEDSVKNPTLQKENC